MESHFLRTSHTTFSAKRSDIAKKNSIFCSFRRKLQQGETEVCEVEREESHCVSVLSVCAHTASGPNETRPTTFDGGLAAKKVSQVNRCF